ncbi:MAG: flagellar filament capping protein FliD [Acidovorax sp.]
MTIKVGSTSVPSALAQKQSKDQDTTAQDASQASILNASPLAQAHKRIGSQVQATTATLSTLGQFKSAMADLKTAASALNNPAGADNTQSLMEKFVAAYNATVKAAGTSGQNASADTSVARELRQMRTALHDAGGASLSSLGLSLGKDGTLALDRAALEKNLQSNAAGTVAALGQLGQRVAGAADKALAQNGHLNTSLERLGDKNKALQHQQDLMVDAASQLNSLFSASTAAPVTGWSQKALSAYLTQY